MLEEIFSIKQDAYSNKGYPDRCHFLHQGSIAGNSRATFPAMAGSQEMVRQGHFLAWGPTLAGVKSENTILLDEGGVEISTEICGWPMMLIECRMERHIRVRLFL